ncbi:unnamed protein product [Moneuplotes crassus]|uniref:Uncharacterized protein n=1 Tax=Euplotes crassus TaxID=5936 RepID=A0AAD1Y008_EUPCR|nr:unnamed protein product [Moneuplotes crassus]
MDEERKNRIIFKRCEKTQEHQKALKVEERQPISSMRLIKPCFKQPKKRFYNHKTASIVSHSKDLGVMSPDNIKRRIKRNTDVEGQNIDLAQYNTQNPSCESSLNNHKTGKMKRILNDTFHIKRIKYFEKLNKEESSFKDADVNHAHMNICNGITDLHITHDQEHLEIMKEDNNPFSVKYGNNLDDQLDLNLRSITLKIPTLKNYVRRRSSRDTYTSSNVLGSQKEIQIEKIDLK